MKKIILTLVVAFLCSTTLMADVKADAKSAVNSYTTALRNAEVCYKGFSMMGKDGMLGTKDVGFAKEKIRANMITPCNKVGKNYLATSNFHKQYAGNSEFNNEFNKQWGKKNLSASDGASFATLQKYLKEEDITYKDLINIK